MGWRREEQDGVGSQESNLGQVVASGRARKEVWTVGFESGVGAEAPGWSSRHLGDGAE